MTTCGADDPACLSERHNRRNYYILLCYFLDTQQIVGYTNNIRIQCTCLIPLCRPCRPALNFIFGRIKGDVCFVALFLIRVHQRKQDPGDVQ
jgi:hypothetical protein